MEHSRVASSTTKISDRTYPLADLRMTPAIAFADPYVQEGAQFEIIALSVHGALPSRQLDYEDFRSDISFGGSENDPGHCFCRSIRPRGSAIRNYRAECAWSTPESPARLRRFQIGHILWRI